MASLENLPIDIHYNKLQDWLINRRHCIQEWPARAVAIREKINEALVDMPKHPKMLELLEGTYINYFHCKKIIELLKEDEESGKKNMFGRYSSQRMKDWSEIIKMYEKDGIYLGETAQMLARNVNYEVPALKRQIAKCQQIKKESERKQTLYITKAEELRKKYDATCKQMGIEGKKIKSELSALVQDLPAQFQRISESASKLSKSVQFYDEFVDFITNRSEEERNSLPMLKYLMENGNSTTYQWRTGEKPEVIEEAKIFIDTSDENEVVQVTDDIDWGDPGAMTDSAIDFGDEIDFNMANITVETGGTEEGDQNPDTGAKGHESDSNGIDWTDVVIVDKPDAEGVAKGEDAMSILDNPRTRTLFIDDLMELEAFLAQRLYELELDSAGGDVLASSQMQDAPSSIQLQSQVVTSMISQVRDVLAAFSSVKMHHLLSIRNSPRYVDRLKENLKQMLNLADKMVFLEKQMLVKYKEADSEQSETQPKLELVIKRTKEMQKQMQSDISTRYKDRKVNIMGEINTM
ncbi:CDK5 regulatory subunit-associated protein 3-like [Crassostrea virginica]|uniref:CDK5 regulatory subunit-associated protein 3-like n=1 Tax=Crassostrea virginica TaxID=6565 RepID=A0A8B8A6Q0_CRAVI|nr:CDK5 regulatory subunit-associated protein 3-like [Crassostrea virginica]